MLECGKVFMLECGNMEGTEIAAGELKSVKIPSMVEVRKM